MMKTRSFLLSLAAALLFTMVTGGQPAAAAPGCAAVFAKPEETATLLPPIEHYLRPDLRYQRRPFPAELADGTMIEGSARHGGIQPDYLVSLRTPEVREYLGKAAKLRERNLPVRDLVTAVNALTKEALPRMGYYGWRYRQLLRKTRAKRTPIELEAYFAKGCGVCRENALANHFALRAAGLPARFSYVRMKRDRGSKVIVEDHAINLLEIDGQEVVIDAYFFPFNGLRLKDLMAEPGVNFSYRFGRAAVDPTGNRVARILEQLDYPRAFVPVGSKTPSP